MSKNIHPQLDQILNHAKQDHGPQLDVRCSVLEKIAPLSVFNHRIPPSNITPARYEKRDLLLMTFSALSVTVASIAILFGADAISLWDHPAIDLILSSENFFE